MSRPLLILSVATLATGSFFVLNYRHNFTVAPARDVAVAGSAANVPEAEKPPIQTSVPNGKTPDLPPQTQLPNPPAVIKAVYATSWTAGTPKSSERLINLIKTTELNAVVIDLKDFSGTVTYSTELDSVKKYGAREIRIPRINTLIKELHDNNIYVIGRVTVFQDPILAKARPDLAIKNKDTGKVWTDNKGLAWMDPAGQETWDYITSIANDAASRGFDEINFDYVRFPTDGSLGNMVFPFYDQKIEKHEVLREFFGYLRDHIKSAKISADVFGLTTVAADDMGIGQVIEDAAEYFDYVAPMVYPSHYATGFVGYKNPAAHPYEVITYSLESAVDKFLKIPAGTDGLRPHIGQLRPWLQDFDLGTPYTAAMITKEMNAVTDSFCITEPIDSSAVETAKTPGPGNQCKLKSDQIKSMYNGWMLWDPANTYTVGALQPK